MHKKQFITAGKNLEDASKVLIMIHGRGASAEDILTLADHFEVNDFALIAPEATNHTWYPYSFLAPPSENEPWLSSALSLLKVIMDDLKAKGVRSENIFFLGFSQGACLALEFVTRNAEKYGGIAAFTGKYRKGCSPIAGFAGWLGSRLKDTRHGRRECTAAREE